MHRLFRQVRFCVDPFGSKEAQGCNSYAGRPCGDGLSLYLALCVELAGRADEETGFVVNVVEIDRAVGEFVVPIFTASIKDNFNNRRYVSIALLCELLKRSWGALKGRFGQAKISRLELELNPFRKIRVDSEDCRMVYFSEKFEFAAMHKLWNEKFSDERNFEVFGKCANPAGHGHNYVIEVTVSNEANNDFSVGQFESVVKDQFLELVDHKNLNVDVVHFKQKNPTVENIAAFAWERLAGKFENGRLSKVTVWENDRTYCSYEESE